MGTAGWAKGGTAVGGRRWTLDFSVKEEDIQMTEIIVSGGRVPESSVDAWGTEVMWTDYKRHSGLGARSRRNAWAGRRVGLGGRVWWFERLLECNHSLVAILCIGRSV